MRYELWWKILTEFVFVFIFQQFYSGIRFEFFCDFLLVQFEVFKVYV